MRSTDLLSLPNVNPDMSYAFNMVIEESMKDIGTACVQAALLYTSSQGTCIYTYILHYSSWLYCSFHITGERRIRVHTLALPVTEKLSDLYAACNVTAIVGLLGKMGKSLCAHLSLVSLVSFFLM